MAWFAVGLALGLLINRQGKKPLLRFPLRCWFFGHRLSEEIKYSAATDSDWICSRCRLMVDQRMTSTFWTD